MWCFRAPVDVVLCFRALATVLQGASCNAVLQGASYSAVLQGSRLPVAVLQAASYRASGVHGILSLILSDSQLHAHRLENTSDIPAAASG